MSSINTEKTFKFNKDSNIILYGAATTGTIMMNALEEQGYEVRCFLDKRADEMDKLSDKPVYRIDSNEVDRDAVVVIAVKNVFEHTNIVNLLVENGFSKIIYRSINLLEGNGSPEDELLNNAYDAINDGRPRESENIILPRTLALDFPKLKLTKMEYDSGKVRLKVPVTMIFTDRKPQSGSKVAEQPLAGLMPHIEFVDFVLGRKEGEPEKYLDYCRNAGKKMGTFEITDSWEQNVLKNRAEVILRMNHSYDLEPDFFERAVIDVRWNSDRKCFNLCSGKHRAVFLLEKGRNYITVRMPQGDFDAWRDSLEPENTRDDAEYIQRVLPSPAENPWMYDIPCPDENFWFNLVRAVVRSVAVHEYDEGNTLFKGYNILTNLDDGGFLKRYFDRCKAKTVYINNPAEAEDFMGQRCAGVCMIVFGKEYYKLRNRADHCFVGGDAKYCAGEPGDVILKGFYRDKPVWIKRVR